MGDTVVAANALLMNFLLLISFGLDGINNFSKYTNNESIGYNGPCPPLNETKPDQYEITIYALNIQKLPIAEP